MFPEMRMTRKIFTRATANLFFLINLINLFNKSLHLKEPHLFFYKQLGQASALKVTYIVKFFGIKVA